MTDIQVLPTQLDEASKTLWRTADDINASWSRLHDRSANERGHTWNSSDPAFSAAAFAHRREQTLGAIKVISLDVRALGDEVQSTMVRMVAADSGGEAATTDSIPGQLLRPGIGFGSCGADDAALWWLDALSLHSAVNNITRIEALGPALRTPGTRATIEALDNIPKKVPGTASYIGNHIRRASPHVGSAANRVTGSGLFDDAARTVAATKNTPAGTLATKYGGKSLSLVGAAFDAHTSATAFQDGDIEKGTLYAIRSAGGVATVVPGGQVIGLTVVGATYVYEYREELWGGAMTTLDFAKDIFS